MSGSNDPAPGPGARRPPLAAGALLLLWPLVVWGALTHASPRVAALVVGAGVVALAALGARGGWLAAARPFTPGVVLAALTAATGSERFLLAQPVLVNLALAGAFGASLRPGAMPMIERFARRIAEPPPGADAHCRQFTWAWFLFALANAAVSAAFAVGGSVDGWALWSGPGSYAAIGALVAFEWGVRRRRFGPTPRSQTGTIGRRWTRRAEPRSKSST